MKDKICTKKKFLIVNLNEFHNKVALYTKGFTFYEPTSQYGNFNILCN